MLVVLVVLVVLSFVAVNVVTQDENSKYFVIQYLIGVIPLDDPTVVCCVVWYGSTTVPGTTLYQYHNIPGQVFPIKCEI